MEREYDYKLKQLRAMLEAEEQAKEGSKYGANLQHWFGTASPINLDAAALKCLIAHYTKRNNPV